MRRGPWLPAIALSLALARCPSAHGQIDLFFIEAAAAGKAPAATDAAGAENAAREDGDLLAAARTRLELASGDVLAGELADCPAAGKIAWQADGFASSFLFPTAAVGAVQFPLDAEVKQPTGEFRVELVAGDVLFGAVQELTADVLRLDTPEFGVLEIARSEIRQLERWGAVEQVNYFGPNGMAGWTALDGLKGWRAAGGRLEATGPGVIELTACRIPQRAMIELELAWGERPEFSIQVVSDDQAVKNFAALVPHLLNGRRDEAPPRPPVALELTAIGGQLILLTEGLDAADVALVDDLHGGARRLQLILYVDPKTQTASAYGYGGRKIADLKVPSDVFGKSLGILRIANRSGELRVNRLVVRDWSGELPTEAAGDATYVQDKDGKSSAAGELTIKADEKDDDALVATSPDLGDALPLAEIARITLPASEEKQTDAGDDAHEDEDGPHGADLNQEKASAGEFDVRVATKTGVRLSGQLLKASATTIELRRRGVEAALKFAVADLQSLESLAAAPPPGNKADRPIGRLTLPGVDSRGALVEEPAEKPATEKAAAGSTCLAWRPSNSETASYLQTGVSGRIVYRVPPPAAAPAELGSQRINVRPINPVAGALRAFSRAISGSAPRAMNAPAGQLLWLKTGDCIACRITSIDERGVSFESPAVEATFIPHKFVKAWDAAAGRSPTAVDPRKFQRLLTLPRMQRDNPPMQIVESHSGDFLRGTIASMDDETVALEVRLETRRIPRDKITRIIWLDDEKALDRQQGDAGEAGRATPGSDSELVQAVRRDGGRMTFYPQEFHEGTLSGTRDPLGACRVDLATIDELLIGDAISAEADKFIYGPWRLHAAPDPRYLSDPQGASAAGRESGLVGKVAPDFRLNLAGGGQVKLSDERGKVVVIEFWATWCGFCMQAMPRVAAIVGEYPADRVAWLAVNLQEDERTVVSVLERLKLSPRVPLDIDGATAEKFQVAGLPQVVVVDPEGKVAQVFVGSNPRGDADLKAAIDTALMPAAKDPAAGGE